jgi:hypothetical protein
MHRIQKTNTITKYACDTEGRARTNQDFRPRLASMSQNRNTAQQTVPFMARFASKRAVSSCTCSAGDSSILLSGAMTPSATSVTMFWSAISHDGQQNSMGKHARCARAMRGEISECCDRTPLHIGRRRPE